MADLLSTYVASDYLESLSQFVPFLGAGIIIGLIFYVIGLLWGLVIRLAKFDV